MAKCRKNAGYSCSSPSDCSKRGCSVDRSHCGVSDMNEVWSGKKSWPKPRDTNESPASRSSGSSNTSGSGVGGIVVAGAVILVLISVFNRSGSVSKVAAPPPPQIQPSTLAPSPPTQVVIPTPILAPADTKTSAVSAQSPALRVGSSLTFQEPVSANVSSSPTTRRCA